MQVRTRLRLCPCHGGTRAQVGCFATASRWWIVSVAGANTKASQCNRRERGFRAAAFCKVYARSGAKPIPTSGVAGRTGVVETANGTGRMPLDDRCRLLSGRSPLRYVSRRARTAGALHGGGQDQQGRVGVSFKLVQSSSVMSEQSCDDLCACISDPQPRPPSAARHTLCSSDRNRCPSRRSQIRHGLRNPRSPGRFEGLNPARELNRDRDRLGAS